MASRTGPKAAIKRASKQARSQMRRLDARATSQLRGAYVQAADHIADDIKTAASGDGSLQIDVLQQLLEQVNARLDALSNIRGDQLDAALSDAAGLGAAPFAEVVAPELLASVSHDAVQFVQHFIAGDGLQLSDRIWRIDRHARDVVGNAIQQAVIQGKSAADAAQQFLQRGEGVPPELLAKMSKADAGRIARDAGHALLSGNGNPTDNAMRLFRTEINRAHGEAYQAAAFDHPDVIGTRFLLSPNHPRTDICDMHASVNRYGLGPGVYPKDKNPWPAHPNTLSFTEAVFADEVSPEDKSGKETRIEWLKRQPVVNRESVLGSQMKRHALDQGHLTEGQIGTPWRDLKKAYARKGVEILPKPKKVVVTDNAHVVTALRREEKRIRSFKREQAVLIDSDGEVILKKNGSRNQVSFTASEAEHFEHRTFTHNHPGGNSFSPEDIRLAMHYNMAEMRATSTMHRHVMTRPSGGWSAKRWEAVAPDVQAEAKRVKEILGARIKAGEITLEQARAELADLWHQVWSRVAVKHGLIYRREVWDE